MTAELEPAETVEQLAREKVECEWLWRETRDEDWLTDEQSNSAES